MQFDAFLSHNSLDKPEVELLAHELMDRGLRPWLDKWHLGAGELWIPALEKALENIRTIIVCCGEHGIGTVQMHELVAALGENFQNGSKLIVPVIMQSVRQNVEVREKLGIFLRSRTWIDLRQGREIGIRSLVTSIKGGRVNRQPNARLKSPYRGLLVFEQTHAPNFFGRLDATAELVKKLSELTTSGLRLLTVVGASGSGKSSLVLAGVVPAIRTGQLDASYLWKAIILRPGPRPSHELARQILRSYGPKKPKNLSTLAQEIRTSERVVSDEIDLLPVADSNDARYLLVFDQFEEIFTVTTDIEERRRVIDNLVHAATVPGGRTTIVLTLRADFLGKALQDPKLAPLLKSTCVLVTPMTAQGLKDAIERPALRNGIAIETAVVDTLVDAVIGQPGDLPLLQFVLEQLWTNRDGHTICWSEYARIGELKGAISKHAEECYKELDDRGMGAVVREVFSRLIHLGDGEEDTKRRILIRELTDMGLQANVVIDRLVAARLLTAHETEIEISHEVLIRGWERLQGWLVEDRQFLLWRQRMNNVAVLWDKNSRSSDLLLSGLLLDVAERYLGSRCGQIGITLREFISASRERRDEAVAAQRREQAEKEKMLAALTSLSDVKRLQELEDDAAKLWPARPTLIPKMEDWIQRAQELLNRIPYHERELEGLQGRGTMQSDGKFTFSTLEEEWQYDVLSELVRGLREFSGQNGTIASVTERVGNARTIKQRSVTSFQGEWSNTIRSIAKSPLYKGLVLSEQLGLIPLGSDSESGYEEFLHIESHEGPLPKRTSSGKLVLTEGVGVILVLLPAGDFWMGSQCGNPNMPCFDPNSQEEEQPVHKVSLGPFFIAKYELTQAHWLRFTGSNPSTYGPDTRIGGYKHTLLHPIEQIGWNDAMRELEKVALCLPTEAQWEYAARGGTDTCWWTGDQPESLSGAANLADRFARENGGSPGWTYEEWLSDGFVFHAPVNHYRANPFGLHSVHGNVWEWTLDAFTPYTMPLKPYTGERLTEDKRFRVSRGGTFSNKATNARSARRSYDPPDAQFYNLGVRPARPIE